MSNFRNDPDTIRVQTNFLTLLNSIWSNVAHFYGINKYWLAYPMGQFGPAPASDPLNVSL